MTPRMLVVRANPSRRSSPYGQATCLLPGPSLPLRSPPDDKPRNNTGAVYLVPQVSPRVAVVRRLVQPCNHGIRRTKGTRRRQRMPRAPAPALGPKNWLTDRPKMGPTMKPSESDISASANAMPYAPSLWRSMRSARSDAATEPLRD